MANYSIAQHGTKAITSSDTSPLAVTLPSEVKLGSSIVIPSVRDSRKAVKVQRGSIAITDGDVGNTKDATITAVVMEQAHVQATWRENRAGNARGATVKLQSTTAVRATWPGTLAGGETVDVDFEVIERLPARRAATVRITDTDELTITWDGTLEAGETIDVAYTVLDLDDVGDDLLEILFRCQRILAYLGENLVTDVMQFDDAGNVIACRVRIFDTKAHAENCTFDLPEGSPLETGELARANLEQDIDKSTNNRVSLLRTLSQVIDTPGVD